MSEDGEMKSLPRPGSPGPGASSIGGVYLHRRMKERRKNFKFKVLPDMYTQLDLTCGFSTVPRAQVSGGWQVRPIFRAREMRSGEDVSKRVLLQQCNTAWCSEIRSLMSLEECNSGASSDVDEPISLHQAVCKWRAQKWDVFLWTDPITIGHDYRKRFLGVWNFACVNHLQDPFQLSDDSVFSIPYPHHRHHLQTFKKK